MLSQVAEVHKRFGMKFFHIGADEAFNIGVCNGTIKEIQKQGGHDRVILWHISQTGKYLKKNYKEVVLIYIIIFIFLANSSSVVRHVWTRHRTGHL